MQRSRGFGPLLAVLFVVAGGLVIGSKEAHAQYKSTQWGVYVGAGFFIPNNNLDYFKELAIVQSIGQLPAGTQPIQGSTNTTPYNGELAPRSIPFALVNPMLHLEFAFAVGSSFNWWIKIGFTGGLTFLPTDPTVAKAVGGTVLWLEGNAGPRYYFLTDSVRPYFEFGVRLPGLAILSAANDIIPTSMKVFPGFYGQFGLEFILVRDIALSIIASYTRFIILGNMAGFNDIDAKLGFVFYL